MFFGGYFLVGAILSFVLKILVKNNEEALSEMVHVLTRLMVEVCTMS